VRFTKPQSLLLDLARAISAQLVLIGHVASVAGLQNPKFLYQNLGVATFFVLSGLLVTHSIMSKPKEYSFSGYLIDRGARIFVPYVPAIAFIVICSLALHLGGPTDPFTIVANLFMAEDYPLFRYVSWLPDVDRVGTGRQLWSVAMEWWFYMAAASVYFAGRLPAWSSILILPGLVVMFFNMTIGLLGIVWIAGALIAILFFKIPRLNTPANALLASALVLLASYRLFAVQGNFYDLAFCLLLAIALVFVLWLVENWKWIERFETPIMFLAAYSYTLYLTHYTVMEAISFENGVSRVILVIISANAVAIAMWWLFERHHRAIASTLKANLRRITLPTASEARIEQRTAMVPIRPRSLPPSVTRRKHGFADALRNPSGPNTV